MPTLELSAFPLPEDDRIEFPGPVRIERVAYIGTDGAQHVIPRGEYAVDPIGRRHLAPWFGRFWPDGRDVRIEYETS